MKKFIKSNIYPLVFNKVNGRLSPNGFRRIYYNHIRKCGGTSINKALIRSLGGDETTYEKLAKNVFNKINLPKGGLVGWNTAAINRSSFFYAFSHEPLHKLRIETDTFTICSLREPVDRVISHFRMLKDMVAEGSTHIETKNEQDFAYGDFDNFLENITREHLEAQLFNFSGNYDVTEALSKLQTSINYIQDFSSVDKDLSLILGREFSLDIDYQHLRKSKTKFEPSEKELNKLRDMLTDEINFYEQAQAYFYKR